MRYWDIFCTKIHLEIKCRVASQVLNLFIIDNNIRSMQSIIINNNFKTRTSVFTVIHSFIGVLKFTLFEHFGTFENDDKIQTFTVCIVTFKIFIC